MIYTEPSCRLSHYGLGIIIVIDGRRWYLNSFAPQWILDTFKTCNTSLMIINQSEFLVILCVVLTFGDLLKDHRVWFWCDNTTTLSIPSRPQGPEEYEFYEREFVVSREVSQRMPDKDTQEDGP